MMTPCLSQRSGILVLGLGLSGLLLYWVPQVSAQIFSSGSSGVDGAFAPTSDTTLTVPASGVFNFTTVNIPAGVVVRFVPNSANTPVTMLASGDVVVAGTIDASGANGLAGSSTGPAINLGGVGGPGGFAGGQGQARGSSTGITGGQGPGGGTHGANATYGAPSEFVSLLPLFGGSGGGGGPSTAAEFSGASGGGGGGALAIASSTRINVSGVIRVNGGDRGSAFPCSYSAGSGSGGALRLVAPEITGSGRLEAVGGPGVAGCAQSAGDGRIRLEAMNLSFTGISAPVFSSSTVAGPVTVSSNPAVMNLPTLTISSVGGISPPPTPGGSFTSADLVLPQGTTNPVPIVLTATNTPVGTVFSVRLITQSGVFALANTAPSTGTFAVSTATVSFNFATGQVNLLNAFASFTLPVQTAGLYPLIDGEPIERVLVAANYGEPSTVTLIARSGKAVPADRVAVPFR